MLQQLKKLNVFHITFNMGFGGTEQVIKQLITGMTDHGVHSEILCIDGHIGSLGEQLQKANVPVHAIQRASGFDRELISHIRQRILRGKADIVHCHQYTPYFYGFMASLGTQAKLVFTEHGRFHPDRYRYKAILINPLMAIMTPAIVAISNSTKLSLSRYEFIPGNKIQVIYNGIRGLERNPERAARVRQKLGIPADAFVAGTVSRLDPVKNQPMMLRAFKRFLEKNSDSWLLMVGDGPDSEMLKSLANDLGIASRVIFTGFIKEPVDYLATMDLFLLSSHTEGTSMTLLEAMSLGIPSVVTNVGGNPEVVEEGETGYLIPANDDIAFARAMLQLKTDSGRVKKLSEQSRQRFMDKFSIKIMTDQYLKLYQHFSLN